MEKEAEQKIAAELKRLAAMEEVSITAAYAADLNREPWTQNPKRDSLTFSPSQVQRKVRAARRHVEEEILTSKCPRCSRAFIDFEGCCALSCSNCPCNFCAYCGEDCGGSEAAHRHVVGCPAKPDGADPLYPGSPEVFERAQAKHRAAALEAFLLGLEGPVREALLREMQGGLRTLYSQVLDCFSHAGGGAL